MREWYDDMEGDCWADAQCHTIRNWPSMFRRWLKNRARFAALRAVPEQPRRVRTRPYPAEGRQLHPRLRGDDPQVLRRLHLNRRKIITQ